MEQLKQWMSLGYTLGMEIKNEEFHVFAHRKNPIGYNHFVRAISTNMLSAKHKELNSAQDMLESELKHHEKLISDKAYFKAYFEEE